MQQLIIPFRKCTMQVPELQIFCTEFSSSFFLFQTLLSAAYSLNECSQREVAIISQFRVVTIHIE